MRIIESALLYNSPVITACKPYYIG